MELIKDYDYKIWYHPRKANVMANALSRMSPVSITCMAVGELLHWVN